MTESKEITSKKHEFTNEEIIQTHLNHYRYSPQSVKARKYNLNYFFNPIYFGYSGHIFDINKRDLFEYFDYLNNLDTIALETKKMKWTILKSLLEFNMEYYDDFIVIIPKKTIQWKPNHKKAETNRYVIADKKDIEEILYYFKSFKREKYYLIFRIFVETGMRKGELINIDYDGVFPEKRYIDTIGKTGRKIYYISEDLADKLRVYIVRIKNARKYSKALFVTKRNKQYKRYSERTFNLLLKRVLKELGIEKNITCHTFRRSINTHRKLMGCPPEDRKILLFITT